MAEGRKIYLIDASRIASEYGLVSAGMPLVSSVMLGAMEKVLELAPLEILEEVIKGKMTNFMQENLQGARKGYAEVKEVSNRLSFGPKDRSAPPPTACNA